MAVSYWYEMRKQAEGIVRLDYGIRQVRLEQNEAHAIASVQTAYTHFSINYQSNFHIFLVEHTVGCNRCNCSANKIKSNQLQVANLIKTKRPTSFLPVN